VNEGNIKTIKSVLVLYLFCLIWSLIAGSLLGLAFLFVWMILIPGPGWGYINGLIFFISMFLMIFLLYPIEWLRSYLKVTKITILCGIASSILLFVFFLIGGWFLFIGINSGVWLSPSATLIVASEIMKEASGNIGLFWLLLWILFPVLNFFIVSGWWRRTAKPSLAKQKLYDFILKKSPVEEAEIRGYALANKLALDEPSLQRYLQELINSGKIQSISYEDKTLYRVTNRE